MLILSAPVGSGHDVAARRVAAELGAEGMQVEVADGLALLGVRLEALVIAGYRFQLRRAPWSWRLLYAAMRSARAIRVLGSVLRVLGGDLDAFLGSRRPDLVISTYPLVSAALAALRRGGRLPYRCVTLVTDFDPHPGWVHPDLDANLVVAGSATGTAIRPPVGPSGSSDRAVVLAALGLDPERRVALVVGGAWGFGDLGGAARAVCASGAAQAVVVTGHNEELRTRLEADPTLTGAVVLGFRADLPDLLAASDLLVQHAGGLTCLEAFAVRVPVVMFNPIAGHGAANTRAMLASGVVSHAADEPALVRLLGDPGWWAGAAAATVIRARRLSEQPSVAAVVTALGAPPAAPIPVAPMWRRAPLQLAGSVTAAAAVALVVAGPESLRDLIGALPV